MVSLTASTPSNRTSRLYQSTDLNANLSAPLIAVVAFAHDKDMTCPQCGFGGIGRASLDWANLPWILLLQYPFRCDRVYAKRERNSPEHSSLQAAININLDALVHDLHESGVVLLADNEWVRISGLSCSKGRQLAGKSIHDRMVLQFNVDLHLLGPLLEVIERM